MQPGEIDGEKMIRDNNAAVGYCADWRAPDLAPYGETVIGWGNGGLRFMYRDDSGQWRNMMRAPKAPPKFWCFPPEPPSQESI